MKPHLANALVTAARRESTSGQIDVEHVYLGLIAIGGGAARILAQHGATLESARGHVRRLLGPEPAETAEATSVSPMATALLQHFSRLSSTHEALAMMLFETPEAPRLVAADHVDPQALIKELGDARDITNPPKRIAVDRSILPKAALAHEHTHYFPIGIEDVASALTDPEFLPEWALPERTEGELDGTVFRHQRGATTTAVKFEAEHERTDSGHIITWVQTMLEGPNDGENLQYDRFELIPGLGGTDVVRSAGHRMFGRFARVLAPIVGSIATGYGMSYRAYSLSAEIVERCR